MSVLTNEDILRMTADMIKSDDYYDDSFEDNEDDEEDDEDGECLTDRVDRKVE